MVLLHLKWEGAPWMQWSFMNIGMNYMREHVVQEARIMYVITKGGEVPNNVPPDAEVWYFIRAPRRTQVDHIWNWMQDVAKGAALMTQTKMSNKFWLQHGKFFRIRF